MNGERGPGGAPQRIGKYLVEKVIGRGAMGLVVLARDPTIGRPVALKTVHVPQGLSDAQVREFRERFLREARAAGGLSHPAIVTVYEAYDGSEGGVPFIAMEFVEGTPWNVRIKTGRPRDPEEVLPLVSQLASALDYAHRRGIVHRDVKPANVMETADGRVKLMDFGIARVPTSELTQEGQCPGTPAYMSPEQVRGEKVDGRSDLFSLGAVLYELLTCRRAFTGDAITSISYQIVNKPTPLAREVVPSVSPSVDAIVQHLMAKNPGERYATARELAEDIDAYMAGAALPHAGAAPLSVAPGATLAQVSPAGSEEETAVPSGAPAQKASPIEATAVPPSPAEPASAPPPSAPVPAAAMTLPAGMGTVPAAQSVLTVPAMSQPRRQSRLVFVLALGAVLALLAIASAVAVWIAGGGLSGPVEPDLATTNRLAAETQGIYARRPQAPAVTGPGSQAEAPKPKPRTAPKPKPPEPQPEPAVVQPPPAPAPAPPPPPQPAEVTFFFKSGIVKGEFWIRVDGKEAIHHVISRGASFSSETYTGTFRVPPGTHAVTFEVHTEIQNVKGSHEEQATFEPGQKRTLRIVMTKFNKELHFEWSAS